MRPSILPNLLGICRNNLNRSFHNISLFEVGPIFQDTSDRVINNACAIRTGHTASKNSHGDRRVYDIFDIKADMAIILDSIGLDIDKCQIRDSAPSYYHPTRCGSLCLGKNILAYFGQVHPMILKKFDIEPDIFAFELNINELPFSKERYGKRSEYIPSDYQMITRDYAFIVDQSLPVADLLNFIRGVDKKLVRAVELFDIYSGEKIEAGKKSVALSVNIQDDSKTLTETDIIEINKKIIKGIEQKFSAILRDS
jgi:phenylalanyl-tRNA synthetase beta chain